MIDPSVMQTAEIAISTAVNVVNLVTSADQNLTAPAPIVVIAAWPRMA